MRLPEYTAHHCLSIDSTQHYVSSAMYPTRHVGQGVTLAALSCYERCENLPACKALECICACYGGELYRVPHTPCGFVCGG
jgi:hypothetical protein